MDILIRAAQAGGVVTPEMAKKLQHLRRFRNRVHIKTVEELEYGAYPAAVTNAMIEILEEFRVVAKSWLEARQPVAGLDTALIGRALSTAGNVAELEVHDLVAHATLGEGVVLAVQDNSLVTIRFFNDGSVRRLLLPYAPMRKTGVFEPSDEPPF